MILNTESEILVNSKTYPAKRLDCLVICVNTYSTIPCSEIITCYTVYRAYLLNNVKKIPMLVDQNSVEYRISTVLNL